MVFINCGRGFRSVAGRSAILFALPLLVVACASNPNQDDGEDGEAEREPHAVVKFCNDLSKGGADVVLTVEVGFPVAATLSASTGSCTPLAPASCQAIPLGTDVPLTLRDGSQVLWQGGMNQVESGEEWILVAELDDTSGEPTVEGGVLKPEFPCSEIE